jgi:predicted amino acid racemase
MNRITIDLGALRHNLAVVNRWVREHGASLTVVTKALCGHRPVLEALESWGVRSVGDSRLHNLCQFDRSQPGMETWYIRPPHLSAISSVVSLADVSLNTESQVIKALNAEAKRQGKLHRIIIMVELGDLREGVLPQSLSDIVEQSLGLSNIDLLGLGTNLGCLSGVVPSVDVLSQLCLYHEMMKLKFGCKLPLISAGTSATLPLLLKGEVPNAVNHFRVCESILLGTDLLHGGVIEPLRPAAMLEAEVVEIKRKALTPVGETVALTPFHSLETEHVSPGQRGYRAIITVGQVDTEISALTPVDSDYRLVGASSDLAVVNLGNSSKGIETGNTISFRMGYSALVRLMASPYTEKRVTPSDVELTSTNAFNATDCHVPAVAK